MILSHSPNKLPELSEERMHTMIKNQNGVTLTEALVTGIILAILAGGLLAILQLNATETSEGVLNSRLQMQYENIVEQFSRDARFAKLILAVDEDPALFTTYITDRGPLDNIRMYDTLDNICSGYDISSGTLMEYDVAGDTMKTYIAGNSSVAVAPGSYFKLFAGRKYLEAKLGVVLSYKDTYKDTLVADTIFISCRN